MILNSQDLFGVCFCDSYLYFCVVFGSMKCMPKSIHFNVWL